MNNVHAVYMTEKQAEFLQLVLLANAFEWKEEGRKLPAGSEQRESFQRRLSALEDICTNIHLTFFGESSTGLKI